MNPIEFSFEQRRNWVLSKYGQKKQLDFLLSISCLYLSCSMFLCIHFISLFQMPDAVVDYDLKSGKWTIVQQQNLLYERTRVLYGSASSVSSSQKSSINEDDDSTWNDLSDYYACEEYDVPSYDGVPIPLTILYSRNRKKNGENPGLLHGHGAYGEILDKRWRNELKSLLDRGWVIAYADVRSVMHLIVPSTISMC